MKFCPTKHTGRRVAHHHTSYFGLGILLLLLGFALGASTLTATASTLDKTGSIQVTANIVGTLPTSAPTILIPSNGQTFVDNQIIVSGDCSAGLIVEIHKNGYLAGSTQCADNGSYSVKIDLLVGLNTLLARQFNDLGGSPPSDSVLVTYRPSVPVVGSQLLLQTDTSSQSGGIGEELSWTATLIGGTAPYALTWDWGDGITDLKSTDTTGPYTFHHTYNQAGTHIIRITATDKSGQTTYLELTEYTPATPAAVGTSRNEEPGILLALWPLYCLLIMLLWTFYIGEHYGEVHERKHPHLAAHTPALE